MIVDSIISREPIKKGWSGDQKYKVTCNDGRQFLLRIGPVEKQAQKQREFETMAAAAGLGISMPQPVEFGICAEGVYVLQSWIDGEDGETVIPALPICRQYTYGLDAGRILAKIHAIPAPAGVPAWEPRFHSKIDRKIKMYGDCPLQYEKGEAFLQYLEENRHLLADRPQTLQHGDYHIGNMMVNREGVLTIIDFEKADYGDPWEEFNRIVWSAQAAPAFASGMVDGYFHGEVPQKFWQLLALYICSNTLGSLPWAIPFGEREIRVMQNQAAQVLQWYDGMKNVVPTWYKKEVEI